MIKSIPKLEPERVWGEGGLGLCTLYILAVDYTEDFSGLAKEARSLLCKCGRLTFGVLVWGV